MHVFENFKDFQHHEGGMDRGGNVREKSRQLIVMLTNEGWLQNERMVDSEKRTASAQKTTGTGSNMLKSDAEFASVPNVNDSVGPPPKIPKV
jgi:hypothetical protein